MFMNNNDETVNNETQQLASCQPNVVVWNTPYGYYPRYRLEDGVPVHNDERFWFEPFVGGLAGGLLAAYLFPGPPGPYYY